MTKFFDALSGETRELNYHGIKCKREPETGRFGTAPGYLVEIGDPDANYPIKPYQPIPFQASRSVDELVALFWQERSKVLGFLPTVSGDIWAKPANRTQECNVYVIDGQTYHSIPISEGE